MSNKKGFSKFLTGALVGAGLGILFAPKAGSETRKELAGKMDDLINKAKDIDLNELKDKIDDLKNQISELDKEKVLEIAKEKGQQIKPLRRYFLLDNIKSSTIKFLIKSNIIFNSIKN